MVNIIYRSYEKGDDIQLAQLFNRAFQMNGASFVRTPRGWNWRYVQSPRFEPEMIQIAEDRDLNKVVGAVHINLIEPLIIGEDSYLCGQINDVCCDPGYVRMGIATKLMNNALDYMKKIGCACSILTADYKGFPRKSIYMKLGYYDLEIGNIFINFPNVFRLARNFPGFVAILPVLATLSFGFRLFYRIYLNRIKQFNDLTYEIYRNSFHYEYGRALRYLLEKKHSGFITLSLEKFNWARIGVPARRHVAHYVIIKKKNKIIGGASITRKNLYAFKYGIKLRTGMVHEILLDESTFPDKRMLHLVYIYLIDKIMKAARKRKIGLLLFSCVDSDIALQKALTSSGFLKHRGSIIMIKDLTDKERFSKPRKPLFIPTYISLGFP